MLSLAVVFILFIDLSSVFSGKGRLSTTYTTPLMERVLIDFDECNHVLFGSSTPVYLAKNTGFNINYETLHFNNQGDANECYTQKYPPTNEPGDTIYPGVLVVVDYETFKYFHKGDFSRAILSVVDYVLTLYTGYDLMFRQMTQPKIRLNIAGIVIATEADALPFANTETLITDDTVSKMQQHFSKDPFFQNIGINYFLVNVILHRDLASSYYKTEEKGFATHRGKCDRKDRTPVAITGTTGSFLELNVAVHELAHIFGAQHDDDFPGDCNAHRYNVNSETIGSKHSHYFSSCSINSMRNHLKTLTESCLPKNNPPNVGKPHKILLPGKMFSRKDLCIKHLHRDDRFINTEFDYGNCTLFNCVSTMYMKEHGPYHYYNPPDGTTCGSKKVCLNGDCIVDP